MPARIAEVSRQTKLALGGIGLLPVGAIRFSAARVIVLGSKVEPATYDSDRILHLLFDSTHKRFDGIYSYC